MNRLRLVAGFCSWFKEHLCIAEKLITPLVLEIDI